MADGVDVASNYTNLREEPSDHGIGRSRGGLSTKIHQLVDGKGLPLVTLITPRQAGDSPMFLPLMTHLRVGREPGKRRGSQGGRPVGLDRADDKNRNVIERRFCDVEQWRGLATRSDKHAIVYRAAVLIQAAIAWTKQLSDMPYREPDSREQLAGGPEPAGQFAVEDPRACAGRRRRRGVDR